MTEQQWESFTTFRNTFKRQCSVWSARAAELHFDELQGAAAAADGVPQYPLENSVVYPHALDRYTADSDIKLIVIGDNPGKDEQLTKNQNYLVGQAGKLGEHFFSAHPELGINFRQNVLILNKTPVHTAKTKELTYLINHSGGRTGEGAQFIAETVNSMAHHTAHLMTVFGCQVWLVGYGELRPGALFAGFGTELHSCLLPHTQSNVLVFQHFSMNRFSIDLKAFRNPAVSLAQDLENLGTSHRTEILQW